MRFSGWRVRFPPLPIEVARRLESNSLLKRRHGSHQGTKSVLVGVEGGGRRGAAWVRRRPLRGFASALPLAESYPQPVSSSPLIEPDVRISRIRLSDRFHVGHSAPTARFGLHVELLLELFELCRGCQALANLPLVHSSRKHSEPGPLPSTVVTRFPGTMGPSDSWACHALSACSVFTPHAQVSRVAHSTFCTHAAPITPVGHQAWSIAATRCLGLPRIWDGSAPTQSSRGLLRLHLRCGLRTRSTSFRGLLLRGFGSGSRLPSPPDGFRGASTIPRAGLPPAGDVHLSRRTQIWTKSSSV